jgi:hypothetical protein
MIFDPVRQGLFFSTMKLHVLIFCGFCMLVSCSAQRQPERSAHKNSNLNKPQFFQTSAWAKGTEKNKTRFRFILIDSTQPKMTIQLNSNEMNQVNISKSRLALVLDQEQIELSESIYDLEEVQFVVPDNLWIPLVYSRDIAFRFHSADEEVTFGLSKRNLKRLKGFLLRSVQYYQIDVPVQPADMKKW